MLLVSAEARQAAGKCGSLSEAMRLARTAASRLIVPADERLRAQRDAVVAFFVRVTSAAVLYLSQVLLARWMGSYEYGIYVTVWTCVLILGGLSALGLGNGSIRLAAEYNEKGADGDTHGLARGGRALAFASGTVTAILGASLVWAFGDLVENHFVLPLIIAFACIPLYAMEEVQDGLGRGRNWTLLALAPPYILRPLLVLVAMASAHVAGFPMTAATAAVAAIFGVWLAALVQALLINRRLRREVARAAPRYDVKGWLTLSLPFVAIYACELSLQNADVLVISHVMTPADVGIYFAAAKTMSLILFVHYAVGSAVAARFSALRARGDDLALKAFVGDAARWTFWPSLAGAAVILAAGKPLLSLFGPEFAAGYPVMFILVLGFLFRSAMGPAEVLLNMLGEQRRCALIMAATAVLNIVLNVALVPRFGLEGAASASALALATGSLLAYVTARRRLGLSIAIWHHVSQRG